MPAVLIRSTRPNLFSSLFSSFFAPMTLQPRLILIALVLAAHLSLLQALSAALPLASPVVQSPVVMRVIPSAINATNATNAINTTLATTATLLPVPAVLTKAKTVTVQATGSAPARPKPVVSKPASPPLPLVGSLSDLASVATGESPVNEINEMNQNKVEGGSVTASSSALSSAVPAQASTQPLAQAGPIAPTSASTRSVVVNPDKVPASVKLLYQIESSKFPLPLHGELLWIRSEHSYQARLSFGALGQSRVQTSRGQIGDEGLLPDRFSDKYRSELAAHFNRERGLVTFSANTPDAVLPNGAQDRLSVLVQLAALVASAPNRYGPGTTLTLPTIGPRDADLWVFAFGAAETLDLPGGAQPAIKLVRSPRQTYDQKVEIWLVPALGYLPGRIRITESNGDAMDQKWVSSEAPVSP